MNAEARTGTFTKVRQVRGYYISPVKFYPYFPFELRYFPTWPQLDRHRSYTVEVGAPIGERKRTMPKRQLVAEQWDEFARNVLPPNVGAAQRRDMRGVFYAGANALLELMETHMSKNAEPTPDDLQKMRDISEELGDFFKTVKGARV